MNTGRTHFKKGYTPWIKGKKHTLESREKMSRSLMGRVSPRKGVSLSSETKEKIRQGKLGHKASPETRKKMSVSAKRVIHTPEWNRNVSKSNTGKLSPMKGRENLLVSGEKNGNWKGDNVGYRVLHKYIEYHYPKPLKCSKCGQVKRLDLSNNSGEYKRDLADWEYICRKCHIQKDKSLNLHISSRFRK